MDSDTDSIDDDLNSQMNDDEMVQERAEWGKTKYNYYYTDYVDKDYPSKLTAKEERLAAIEQEEALRIQKKLLSALNNVDLEPVFDGQDDELVEEGQPDLLEQIENQNKAIEESLKTQTDRTKKRKRLRFEDEQGVDDEYEQDDDDDDEEESGEEDDDEDNGSEAGSKRSEAGRQRRPINMAIKKNRGLTPYKKKEYRNPRVKHKLKYKKAISKRRRNVQEAQSEYHRYSGEPTGIKTSTVKSIKLC